MFKSFRNRSMASPMARIFISFPMVDRWTFSVWKKKKKKPWCSHVDRLAYGNVDFDKVLFISNRIRFIASCDWGWECQDKRGKMKVHTTSASGKLEHRNSSSSFKRRTILPWFVLHLLFPPTLTKIILGFLPCNSPCYNSWWSPSYLSPLVPHQSTE